MENFVSYLNWRGDLSFEEQPFNEIDNVICSVLSYLNLNEIAAEDDHEKIRLSDAMDQYILKYRDDDTVPAKFLTFADALRKSGRYRNTYLFHYVDRSLTPNAGTDFCAMHIQLNEDTVYVAYRGTTEALIGWKEDLCMSYQIVPAQTLAAEYLKRTMQKDFRYYLGGHSKGGNLAVYAAAFLPPEQQEQVLKIYSNDGPGFCSDIISNEKFNEVKKKMLHILPEFCIVGEIFGTDCETVIVKSSADNIDAHDTFTWLVDRETFQRADKLNSRCEIINEIINQWVESADMDQRNVFVEHLFEALDKNGLTNANDLSQWAIEDIAAVFLSVTMSDDRAKNTVNKFFYTVFSVIRSMDFKTLIKDKRTIQALICFVLGIFICLNPMTTLNIAGSIGGVLVVIYIARRLLNTAFTENGTVDIRKTKVIIQLILICAVVYLIGQKTILLSLSTIIIAALFLVFAYRWLNRSFTYKNNLLKRVTGILVSILTLMMGILPMIITAIETREYMIVVGSMIWIYSLGMFVNNAYKNGQENRRKTDSVS